jgi:RNA polymerase sigma-70 factor (ECF subfamily)
MSDREDHELVEATLAGDKAAFDQLVNRYGPKIYNMTLRITGNPDDALDASQSAFLKAFDKLESFDPTYRFFSWIYRIGLNEALNLVKGRRRFQELDQRLEEGSPDPERQYWGREAGAKLRAAILALKPDYRAALVLRHIDGLSYREMGEILGISVTTAKSRLFTARSLLRQRLADEGLTL